MAIDPSVRTAIEVLIANADRAMAMFAFDNVRSNPEIVRLLLGEVRLTCNDLVGCGTRCAMTTEERNALQEELERLRASLRFFGKYA